jgi:hypothetical protein
MEPLHEREARPQSGFHQVLILLFGYFFFGGEAASLSERVEEAMKEGPARERALVIAGELEGLSGRMREEVLGEVGAYYEALGRAGSTPDELAAPLDGILDSLHATNLRALDLRMQLAGEMTAEEWGALVGAADPEARAFLP